VRRGEGCQGAVRKRAVVTMHDATTTLAGGGCGRTLSDSRRNDTSARASCTIPAIAHQPPAGATQSGASPLQLDRRAESWQWRCTCGLLDEALEQSKHCLKEFRFNRPQLNQSPAGTAYVQVLQSDSPSSRSGASRRCGCGNDDPFERPRGSRGGPVNPTTAADAAARRPATRSLPTATSSFCTALTQI
jgi:hypothetical protein